MPEEFDARRQPKLFPRWRKRAEQVGFEAGERFDDVVEAKDYAVRVLENEYKSIVGMILMGLLVKIAVEAIWAVLKRKFPDVFAGEVPADLLEYTG